MTRGPVESEGLIEGEAAAHGPALGGWALCLIRARQHVPRRLWADLALLLVTLVWGSTFVLVKDAVANYPVFSFLALRFAFASLALAPFAVLRARRGRNPQSAIFLPSLAIGLFLFAGYGFQTLGLHLTSPAKAGFITGLSVAVVPLVSALALRQAPERAAWVGVALAVGGLALLTLQAGVVIGAGDALVFGCAVAYSFHILLTGRFAPRVDPLLLTLGQVVVAMLLFGAVALAWDPRVALSGRVVFAAAFTGLLATAAAFGVQTLAQRFTTTTHTALIFAAEPVFAALASYVLIGELLGPRQLLGCALILVGMLISELWPNGREDQAENHE